MNSTLATWNRADASSALEAMLACCGSKRWAAALVALRPIASVQALSEAADRVWSTMREPDWLEAFACHPRIGERKPALIAPHRRRKNQWRGRARNNYRPAPQMNWCWPNSGKTINSMSNASASRTLSAQPAKAPPRCLQFLSSAWRAIAKPSCARRRSSSGKLCKSV